MPTITSTTHGNLTNTSAHLLHPPSRVLPLLHNHERLISLNPLVTKIVHATEKTKAEDEEVFTVTDHILLLGTVPITTTYCATLSNQKNGVWVNTQAAIGVETSSVWMVEDDREVKDGCVVTESFELVKAPWWIRNFVERTVKDAHQTLLERLAKALDDEVLADKK